MNGDAQKSAASYRDRLVICVGLATGLRETALWILNISQLHEERVRGIECVVFRSMIAGDEGQRKTEGSGYESTGDKASDFPICNEIVMIEWVNFYSLKKDYKNICRSI